LNSVFYGSIYMHVIIEMLGYYYFRKCVNVLCISWKSFTWLAYGCLPHNLDMFLYSISRKVFGSITLRNFLAFIGKCDPFIFRYFWVYCLFMFDFWRAQWLHWRKYSRGCYGWSLFHYYILHYVTGMCVVCYGGI
jgi:hypothetical protein